MTLQNICINLKIFWIGLFFLCSNSSIKGQESHGGEIITKESYLYGRFEVVMQSAEGDGIVSSFFLYNTEAGKECRWPDENNEIDIEMTGNNELIYFTTHHPDPVQPWHYGENFNLNFNPHETVKKYAIEWEPGIVRWLVDDQMIYVQNDEATDNLKYPMAILMNLWASDAVDWVGVWDPSVLPRQARYDYVRYYRYTQGQGNAGTNNNFTLDWEDQFNSIDSGRWEVSDFTRISPLCTFRESNVQSDNGWLVLTLDEAGTNQETIPVTFSVNMGGYDLSPSDKVYLNGSFNNWCGSCNLMDENDGIWSLTLNLKPNIYEYLFTINEWEVVGNAPLGSECDYHPCDEFANYGVHIAEGSTEMVLDTKCWQECMDCVNTSVTEGPKSGERKVVRIYDLMGREVSETPGRVLIYLYDDGSVEKKIKFRIN